MKARLVGAVVAGVLVLTAGCASTPPPTVQTGPNAEVTVDGLYRVDNSVMALAYIKPDMDLRGYTKFLLDPVTVAYQKDPQGRRTARAGGEQNFALRPEQMENMKTMFRETIEKALVDDGGYELVDTPGPDVLRITAELLDLIVRVPTDGGSGFNRTYARSYGEVTMLLELRDSESGEILARVADRRDPTVNPGNQVTQVSPSAVRADTQRLFSYWANLLRQRLDEVRAIEPQ